MIFGKYINRYYLKNAPLLFLGLAALVLVDFFQLKVVTEIQRLYSKWLWLLMAISKPSLSDAKMLEYIL